MSSRNVTDVDDVLTGAAAPGLALRRARARPRSSSSTATCTRWRSHRPTSRRTPAYHVDARASAWPRRCSARRAYERDGHVLLPRRGDVPEPRGLDARPRSRCPRRTATAGGPAAGAIRFDVAGVATLRRERAGLAEPVGLGPPGLARGVRRDGDVQPRARRRRAGRRRRTSPSRTTPTRRAMVEAASVTPVRPPVLHVGRGPRTARRWPSPPATSCWSPTCSSAAPARGAPGAARPALVRGVGVHRRGLRRRPTGCSTGLRKAAGGSLPPRHHDDVLERLVDDLDVPGAVSLALEQGGEAAAYLLDVLTCTAADLDELDHRGSLDAPGGLRHPQDSRSTTARSTLSRARSVSLSSRPSVGCDRPVRLVEVDHPRIDVGGPADGRGVAEQLGRPDDRVAHHLLAAALRGRRLSPRRRLARRGPSRARCGSPWR